jgi:hypothetical protein
MLLVVYWAVQLLLSLCNILLLQVVVAVEVALQAVVVVAVLVVI